MSITRLEVSNFKSFKDLKVDLDNFNILVGANASGKSNFVEIFKFVRDIVNLGLEEAISIQGEGEYLLNTMLGPDVPLRIRMDLKRDFTLSTVSNHPWLFAVDEVDYGFALQFDKQNKEFAIGEERCVLGGRLAEFTSAKTVASGKLFVEYLGGNVNIHAEGGQEIMDFAAEAKDFLVRDDNQESPRKHLMLERLHSVYPLGQEVPYHFANVSTFDFNAALSREANSPKEGTRLKEDGSNLSKVLDKILEDAESRRSFENFVDDLLPFVDSLDIERLAGHKSLMLKVRENFGKNIGEQSVFPASFMSDGTINVICLIVAVYFDDSAVTILEEPERGVHPRLLSSIVSMLQDAATQKQIIATTHNPELLLQAGLDNTLLISRDSDGFSQITRPSENKFVQTFLESDLGVDEMFIQNLLEAPQP